MNREIPDRFQELWRCLREFLEAFGKIQDRLDPGRLGEYAQIVAVHADTLRGALAQDPETLKNDSAGQVLSRAASQALQGAARFAAATGPQAMVQAFQALRPVVRAEEILYELAGSVEDVSRYFLVPSQRNNAALIASLGSRPFESPPRGIVHKDNERGRRGGCSLYVPEYYSPERSWPLVVALHGGSGHGADFLWSWVCNARSTGFLLAAPTSLGRTWSLRQIGADAAALNAMLAEISEAYNVDSRRILLTGISDGGTYAMLVSIVHQSPFTHYAPVAAAVHVLLGRDGAIAAPVKGIRVYQVHGGRDWMFPVVHARTAAAALEKAGAQIKYYEIEDLSHNYPRDENEAIVRWFLE